MSFDLREFDTIVWTEVLARMHPLVLHLPIGLFVALAWLEFWGWFKKSSPDKRRGQGALVWLLVLTTPLGAATGWFLHEGGGYGEPVEWHERGGITLAFVAVVAGFCFWRRSRLYPWMIWIGLGVLVPTAHFGATLTHGEEFLLEPWLEEREPELTPLWTHEGQERPLGDLTDEESADLAVESIQWGPVGGPGPLEFADVLPVFEARCTRCHGAKKQRGELAMHTLEGLLVGGEYDGPALVMGDPDASPLLKRMLLPLDHDDHMPPESKPQPTEAEIAWVRAWIAGEPAPGAAPEIEVDEAESAPPVVEPASEAPAIESAPAPDPARVEQAIETLRGGLAHVQPVSSEDEGLWVDLSASRMDPARLREALAILGPRIAELSFAGLEAGVVDLDLCAEMPRLAQLDLRRLRGSEGAPLDLAPLARSDSLRVLNLAGTPLGPEAVQVLGDLAGLERVFLWDTGLAGRAAELSAARPRLEVVGESPLPDEPLEVEPEVVFERHVADAAGDGGAGDAIAGATNKTCPVTGSPVDPRYTVLYEGRAIGFCCPNCPKTFWQDPEACLANFDGE